jgi:cell division protein FtsQ
MGKIKYRNIIKMLTWGSVCVAFVFICGASMTVNDKKFCKEILVDINEDEGFVDVQDIKHDLNLNQSNIIGRRIDKIDFKRLENSLNNNPYIEKAEIYKSIKGDLKVDVEQKRPIVRVMNNQAMSYYVSDKWKVIPLSNKYSKRTILITGYVDDVTKWRNVRDSVLIYEIRTLTDFILKDEYWSSMIDQIYINEAGRIEVIPSVGDFNIIVGNVDDQIEKKFQKLDLFYKKAMYLVDFSKYKTIDISYKNQVVGIKKLAVESL